MLVGSCFLLLQKGKGCDGGGKGCDGSEAENGFQHLCSLLGYEGDGRVSSLTFQTVLWEGEYGPRRSLYRIVSSFGQQQRLSW